MNYNYIKHKNSLRKKRLLQIFWLTQLALFAALIINLFLKSYDNALFIIGFFLLIVPVYFFAKHNKITLAGNYLLSVLTLFQLTFMWRFAGLRDEVLLITPALVTFSIYIGGRSIFIYLISITLINVLAIGMFNQLGWYVNETVGSDFVTALFIIIIFIVIFYAIWIVQQDMRQTNEALFQHKLKLDEQVKARTVELEKTIGQLIETQHQLIEHEKMASLGRLVAGVAHELNTPLGICVTANSHLKHQNTQFQQQFNNKKLSAKQVENYIENVTEVTQLLSSNLKRSTSLVQSFKAVAVNQTIDDKREYSLTQLLKDEIDCLKIEFNDTQIELQLLAEHDVIMFSYPSAVLQVVSQLVMNAKAHAFKSEQKGKIEVEFSVKENTIELFVIDNGIGIEQQHIHKLFEPFYSINMGKVGAGLGLHIVYNMVTQMLGGMIECNSVINEGTEFKIVLPK